MSKRCIKCGLDKSDDLFYVRKERGTLHSWCKHCSTIYTREKRRKNPEPYKEAIRRWRKQNYEKDKQQHRDRARRFYHKNSRAYLLKKKYGITPETFHQMVDSQGNCCAICRKPFSTTPRVDHSHQTGAVRGLLCIKCNAMLGSINDSPATLLRAVAYLYRSLRVGFPQNLPA